MAEGLEGLDEAALNAKLKAAESYEDRAAIRKALRDLKKSKGIEVGGGRNRGTSQYNRFAGRTSTDAKATVKQSFVPSTSSKTPNPPSTGSSSPSQSVSSPTPPPTSATPPAEREREREEREKREKREREEKEKEERKERERQEREREKERREREREEKEKEKLREEEERREKRRQEREREREERERKEKERKERQEKEREERERKEQEERERQEKEQREREEREKKEKEERERKEREEKEQREREEREKKEQEEKERERANEGGDAIVAEEEDKVKSEQTNKEKEDSWVMVDKEAAKELEKKASIDSTDGRGSDRVQLRKTEPPPTKPRSGTTNTSTDFGVKLKSRTQSDVTSAPPIDTKSKSLVTPTNRTGGGGAPKTLADFQKLTSRGKQSPAGQPTQSNAPKDKRALIRMYINASLEVRPPVSSDQELYQLCTKPSNLCKLINKSVRHTVDLRALTKTPPPTASTAEKTEAIEENMLLVVESARAIGCSVTDNMVEELTRGDKATIDKLIIELIKSRVVHMPGMEDEPSSTFNDLSTLMSKLGLAYTDSEETNGGTGTDSSNGGGGGGVSRSWRDEAVNVSRPKDGGLMVRTDDEHTPHLTTGSWREDKKTPEIDLSKPSLDANLSYEERAAIRRAERERRKKEREGLAVPK